MRKDIFIDNNIACRFCNPLDSNLKDLITWLMAYNDGNDEENAYLVVSKKLLNEYISSCREADGSTSIPVIINQLTRENRLIRISNEQIKDFQTKYFTKKVEKKLRSNNEDRNHIPVVLLSDRKYVLTNDTNFTYDLKNFPGFTVLVSNRPEEIPYKM